VVQSAAAAEPDAEADGAAEAGAVLVADGAAGAAEALAEWLGVDDEQAAAKSTGTAAAVARRPARRDRARKAEQVTRSPLFADVITVGTS
jgi:hypothetical protein